MQARPASFVSLQQHRRAAAPAPGVSSARRLQRCYATAEESKKGLDFTSNKNSVRRRDFMARVQRVGPRDALACMELGARLATLVLP